MFYLNGSTGRDSILPFDGLPIATLSLLPTDRKGWKKKTQRRGRGRVIESGSGVGDEPEKIHGSSTDMTFST